MPDTNEFFITAARGHCEMSMKNTPVGKWLRQSLERLEQSEAENERLREENALLLTQLEDLSGSHEDRVVGGMNEVAWSAYLAEQMNADAEVRLPDGSRVDIITSTHAFEVEWVDKWPEAIGQAVFYGLATGHKPGVWLLLERGCDEDWLQCAWVCSHLGITLRTTKTWEGI